MIRRLAGYPLVTLCLGLIVWLWPWREFLAALFAEGANAPKMIALAALVLYVIIGIQPGEKASPS